jgi:glycosyltransferase involved in cell wall biosynthesis
MPSPHLSVIIPTRNRAALLSKALYSLQNQTFATEQFEVLVVDNGSCDNTLEIVRQAQKKLNNLHYFFAATPGLHAARHLGMEKALSNILVYIDDDARAVPTWLEAVSESFADPQVALVGGKILPEFETAPPLWVDELWRENEWGQFLSFYSLSDCGDSQKEIDPTYIWGCNFSIRKELLSRLGGFHPDSMPESLLKFRGDGELGITKKIRELNLKTVYNPGAGVFHFVSKERLTLNYLYSRSYSQGISDSYSQIRSNIIYRENAKDIIRYWLFLPLRLFRFFSSLNYRKYRLQKIICKGTRAGYRFHQKEVAHDQELKKWVLQETYW